VQCCQPALPPDSELLVQVSVALRYCREFSCANQLVRWDRPGQPPVSSGGMVCSRIPNAEVCVPRAAASSRTLGLGPAANQPTAGGSPQDQVALGDVVSAFCRGAAIGRRSCGPATRLAGNNLRRDRISVGLRTLGISTVLLAW